MTDLFADLKKKFSDGIDEAVSKMDVPEAVRWIESNFYIPETRKDPKLNGRMRLMEYQKDVIREALSRDEKGNYKYSIIVWSDIKKSAKSTIAAAINLYRAHWTEWGEMYVIANDLKQADSRVNYYLRRAIQLNPKFSDKYARLGYRTTAPSGSFIEAIPIDPSGEAGSNADMITFSELWGANEEAKQNMWAEMTLSPTKHGQSFRWIESYAGFQEESELLYSLYDLGVIRGELLWPERLYEVTDGAPAPLELYVNRSAGMLCLWNTKPRCPWQTKEYYCLPLPNEKKDLSVLTKNGWKFAEEITTEDALCTMNPIGEIEYQFPTNIFREEYSGKLLRLKNAKCDLVMTPNHRILGAFASHTRKVHDILSRPFNYEFREAHEAISAQVGWIPGHGNWRHEPLQAVDVEGVSYLADEFIELLAWYLAEGSTRVDKRYKDKEYPTAVLISQDRTINPHKHQVILNLCERLEIKCTSSEKGINIYNAKLARYFLPFGKSHEKRIPRFVLDECSREQLQRFLMAYIAGDGTKKSTSEDGYLLYTNSDGMLLDLLELSFKCGFRPRHIGSYSSAPKKGRRPIHHISLMTSHLGWSQGNKRRHWSYEDAEQGTQVWCPTVPNGNFYVMQKGTCWWTGNSSEEKILPVNQFLRMHRNQWVSSTETFVPMEWWHACARKTEEWPVFDKKRHSMVIALDAAVSDDTFGVWMGCRHPTKLGEVMQEFARRWKPTQGHKIDFVGTDEKPGPEKVIRGLIKDYNVVEVTYDPYQLHDMASRFKQEGLTWFREFSQGMDRLKADSQFRDLIREKRYWHRGEEDMTEHIQNANAKVDPEDRRLRIVKRTEKMKVDLAVAASMGSHEILRLNL